MRKVLPFILCGGLGTRLWPVSREAFPKQFHRLTGSESLFQQTCRRLTGALFGDLHVLANHHHRFLVADQLEEIGFPVKNLILEPLSRNTAPAACIAALIAAKADAEAVTLLAPSDHMIADTDALMNAIASGLPNADVGALITFGIEPDCPHTGYGYIEIEPGEDVDRKVRHFVEKPSLAAAEQYLDSGRFYWNSGIFLFKAATMLDLFKMHAPDILQACRLSLEDAAEDATFCSLSDTYGEAPAISLDYAVAEKAGNMRCVPLKTSWSDVGSWSALWNFMDKDAAGNVVLGDGDVILEDSRNSLAFSDRPCVVLVGVENAVVVAMEDAILIASKDHAESIKRVVDDLKRKSADLTYQHNRVYRPWGWYQILDRGDRHQVKCIMVKPGGMLSLQYHFHRSEHWVVVKGILEVTKGDKVELLSENQSTYIAPGETHRLVNSSKIPAFLIEVQSGSYLGEDDIIRLEDAYRRTSLDS